MDERVYQLMQINPNFRNQVHQLAAEMEGATITAGSGYSCRFRTEVWPLARMTGKLQ